VVTNRLTIENTERSANTVTMTVVVHLPAAGGAVDPEVPTVDTGGVGTPGLTLE